MKFIATACLLLSTLVVVHVVEGYQFCGPTDGFFAIAGSSTVLPVAEKWAEEYTSACPGVHIVVEGGGSSAGAGRVCANEEKGTPVEIGDMSREWKASEAQLATDQAGVYQCVKGNTSRSAIQIDVAIDGLSVATPRDGMGRACMAILGGLTLDQLRWIFSNYTEAQLIATGWDPASLTNSDSDDETHLWSELSASCAAAEIKIVGADSASGTYEYFMETVLVDFENGESFDVSRPYGYTNSQDDEVLADFLEANDDAIGYFGYAYYYAHSNKLAAVPIENDQGDFVAPDPTTVADGSYNPLARRIFMNLLSTDEALALTAPFIKFGLSNIGSVLVSKTGYIALSDRDKEEMLARVSAAMGLPELDVYPDLPTVALAEESGAISVATTTATFNFASVTLLLMLG